jgi:hypothetical protein
MSILWQVIMDKTERSDIADIDKKLVGSVIPLHFEIRHYIVVI